MSTSALCNPYPGERAFHWAWDETEAPTAAPLSPIFTPLPLSASALGVRERGKVKRDGEKTGMEVTPKRSASRAKREQEVRLVTHHLSLVCSWGMSSPVYRWHTHQSCQSVGLHLRASRKESSSAPGGNPGSTQWIFCVALTSLTEVQQMADADHFQSPLTQASSSRLVSLCPHFAWWSDGANLHGNL